MIFLLHKDWNLVINMMIGINKCIRALWDVDDHQLGSSDYEMRDMFELRYRRAFGGNFDDIKGNCVFVDYAPYVFGKIRKKYEIKSEEVNGPNNPLVSLFHWIGDPHLQPHKGGDQQLL